MSARSTQRRRRLAASCLLALFFCLLPSCMSAPPPGYADSAPVLRQRRELAAMLVDMLPAEQQSRPEAEEEAAWLADTAYKAAAGIAAINKPLMDGWRNNMLINTGLPLVERGLCWHYQEDMYRELRRRPLRYFRIGCCMRDRGTMREHHDPYLCPAGTAWPHVVILDAWEGQGRLHVLQEKDFGPAPREDEPEVVRFLAGVYPECHSRPSEHWARVRRDGSIKYYELSSTPAGMASKQGRRMLRNMQEALRARNGKLTNY